MLSTEITAVCLTVFVTLSWGQNIARECKLVPDAGNCRQHEAKSFWTYSSKTSACTQLYGCYSIRDRNIFVNKKRCETQCLNAGTKPDRPVVLPGVPGVTITRECRMNPVPGRCPNNQKRTFWSYSSKVSRCIQVTGCYTIKDRNIWRTRDGCRRGCFNAPGTAPPVIIPGDLTKSSRPEVGTVPTITGFKVAIECRITPVVGTCQAGAKRTMYTFSRKTSSCVEVNGCFSIRDRNIFMSREDCRQNCLVREYVPGQGWSRDQQCFITPAPGLCPDNQKRSYYSYSAKTSTCISLYGCYSVRDRNAFITQEACNALCEDPSNTGFVTVDTGIATSLPQPIEIAIECRIAPTAGQCPNPQKRNFYSYSSKTGDCAQIFGCYSVRDRNVFMALSGCRRNCFVNSSDTSGPAKQPQCYLNPSAGRCPESQKKTVWTYSSKTQMCTQIYGCYSIRDRNVFVTRKGCADTCDAHNGTLPDIPDGTTISRECRLVPTVGRCAENQKRTYYSLSMKTGTCQQIYGCYSIRDRNVFLTQDGCRQNCYVTDGSTPSDQIQPQCYLNPSSGRCSESQKQTFWSYNSNTMTCGQIYGCYSVNDRNIFRYQVGCERTCAVDNSTILPDLNANVSVECRITPAAGRCRQDQKRTYYSYSIKTGACTRIYGCYSIRDRNVFLTRNGCSQNCFKDNTPTDTIDPQCYLNPSPGVCAESQKRTFYSYSSKTQTCMQIFGCYSVNDRNVFPNLAGCDRICAVNSNIVLPDRPDGTTVSRECRITPSVGRCLESQKRTYYSYSSKTGTCQQIFGCYSIRDRNVFLTRDGCRQNCFITDGTASGEMSQQCFVNPSQGRCSDSQKRTFWSYSSKVMACTQIYGCYSVNDRNVFPSSAGCERICAVDTNMTTPSIPEGYHLSRECRIVPTIGLCSQKRTYYTYSTRIGACADVYGCYSLRDRNVFLTQQVCEDGCFIPDNTTSSGEMDQQCYLNPSPGRCAESQKRSYWSYNSKTMTCTQLFGCYSIRDRNVFQSHDTCDRTCAVNTNATFITLPDGRTLSSECRVNPAQGRCRQDQKRSYYSYSTKTGTCTQIYGCYGIRDRNVFLTSDGCQQNCFLTDGNPSTGPNAQCYLNPSASRCAESQKRTYWTYSSKTMTCTQIYGCYSIRDRNVYQTRESCDQMCDVNVNNTIPGLPDGSHLSRECRVTPSAGRCLDVEKRSYFSYSAKTGACTRIHGCYSVRDRNVFYTRDGCNQNCFISDTATPSLDIDPQCYLNPTPSRCSESQKNTVWTYSSKTMSCTQIYGCYGYRDRNVFQTRDNCQQTCAVDPNSGIIIPDGRISRECRLTPSQGRCQPSERRTYYSYSSKTGTCQQIYGCYSIRDRNVFLTRGGCTQNCFIVDGVTTPSGVIEMQCYLNPAPGRCLESQKRNVWIYSSKTMACSQFYGCYSIRDRNVFQSRYGCEQTCAVGQYPVSTPPPDSGISIECRIVPTADTCRPGQEQRTFYSYSFKTSSCVPIYGCYSVRDRNVFTSREGCERYCYVTNNQTPSPVIDRQCYIMAAAGRCPNSQKRTVWTYSTKVSQCTEIYGCYSISDRNVFQTRRGCERTCAVDNVVIPTTPIPGTNIAIECRISPSPGMCREQEKDLFYTYSSKTGACTQIYGCYSIRDRNVFRSSDGCRMNCFTDGSGGDVISEEQCYITAPPGRCSESQKRTYYTYSSKTYSCVPIYGCYSVRDRNVFITQAGCSRSCEDTTAVPYDRLTDLPSKTLESGYRIARECQINPSPGICVDSQRKTFWSFSTKSNTCTRITGCYDIHDRNAWLTQNGCENNCFKNDNLTLPRDSLPLECQMNPTPGRCLPSEERSFWSYNIKLNRCTRIMGCYDFHDRNVWGSADRCQTKCSFGEATTLPATQSVVSEVVPPEMNGLHVSSECKINPSPGRCLNSQRKTFWSFSSKTGSCVQTTGCYNIRDRNTWLTRDSCRKNCFVNETDPAQTYDNIALECRLIPSPGMCLESQRKTVWVYSEKLSACIDIFGCYDFHDRNVWSSRDSCRDNCHVNSSLSMINMADYEIALECQITPTPGWCSDSEQRSYYTFSGKTGGCVEIYGCYTINDRNVWYTNEGCRKSCLIKIPKPNEPRPVAPGCLRTPRIKQCQDNQNRRWWYFNQTSGTCQLMNGCYRLGSRNVFISEKRCDINCFGGHNVPSHGGIATECRLTPPPGICREEEKRTFWSFSPKTSSCIQISGCYTIRDRNMWLTRAMCRNRCLSDKRQQSNAIPNFLAGGVNQLPANEVRRGRRGKIHRTVAATRNRNPSVNINNVSKAGTITNNERGTAITIRRTTRTRNVQRRPQSNALVRTSTAAESQGIPVSKVITNLFN